MCSVSRMCVTLTMLLIVLSQSCWADVKVNGGVTPEPGTVALTFDDGPSPVYTPQILDILKKNNIKATFFVMGPLARKYPNLIKRMAAEGHAVGVHAMTHPKFTRLNDAQLHYEMVGTRDVITNILKKPPICLRAPFEKKNKHVEAYAKAQGLFLVPLAFDVRDKSICSVEQLSDRTINHGHSQQVFLLHDGSGKREITVAALPKIIAGIRSKGLGFSTICRS